MLFSILYWLYSSTLEEDGGLTSRAIHVPWKQLCRVIVLNSLDHAAGRIENYNDTCSRMKVCYLLMCCMSFTLVVLLKIITFIPWWQSVCTLIVQRNTITYFGWLARPTSADVPCNFFLKPVKEGDNGFDTEKSDILFHCNPACWPRPEAWSLILKWSEWRYSK